MNNMIYENCSQFSKKNIHSIQICPKILYIPSTVQPNNNDTIGSIGLSHFAIIFEILLVVLENGLHLEKRWVGPDPEKVHSHNQ